VHGRASHKKTALLRDPLLELIDRIDPSTTVGLRDRALLLLGFAVGLRRSELVALAVEDLPLPGRRPHPDRPLKDRPAGPAARSSWSSTPSRLGPARSARCAPGSTPPLSPPALSFGA
jgi:integrase